MARGVVYDVTNTYLYGRHCPLAKPGHDKEEVKGRPLIQIGGVTQTEGFPLFHKVFDGNVHDTRPSRVAIPARFTLNGPSRSGMLPPREKASAYGSSEAVVAVVGLWFYLRTMKPQRLQVAILVGLLSLATLMSLVGPARSTPPPPARTQS